MIFPITNPYDFQFIIEMIRNHEIKDVGIDIPTLKDAGVDNSNIKMLELIIESFPPLIEDKQLRDDLYDICSRFILIDDKKKFLERYDSPTVWNFFKKRFYNLHMIKINKLKDSISSLTSDFEQSLNDFDMMKRLCYPDCNTIDLSFMR